MKAIIMIFITIFLGKNCSDSVQNDIADATIQYTANSRGSYQQIIIKNQKGTVSRDRRGTVPPQEIAVSDKDWEELIGYFKEVNLEELPNLKDPTQYRFYDGASIADLKITYKGKEYETVSFDHGHPPIAIEKFVNKIVSFGKQE